MRNIIVDESTIVVLRYARFLYIVGERIRRRTKLFLAPRTFSETIPAAWESSEGKRLSISLTLAYTVREKKLAEETYFKRANKILSRNTMHRLRNGWFE